MCVCFELYKAEQQYHDEIMKQLDKKLASVTETKPQSTTTSTIAAMGEKGIPYLQLPRNHDQKEESENVRDIIRQELRKELRNNFRQKRQNQNFRSQRTETGVIICSNCNKRGHSAHSCWRQQRNQSSSSNNQSQANPQRQNQNHGTRSTQQGN